MNFLQKILTALQLGRHIKNSNSGKTFEEQYNETGAFSYDETGFTITYEDIKETIQWKDITELNAYKTDLFTTDRIDMEIVYGDKHITISEELPGWHLFIRKTKEEFPEIDKEWDVKIIFPAFATNYTTIYKRDS